MSVRDPGYVEGERCVVSSRSHFESFEANKEEEEEVMNILDGDSRWPGCLRCEKRVLSVKQVMVSS